MVLQIARMSPSLHKAIRARVGRGVAFLHPFLLFSLTLFLRLGALLGGFGGSVGFKLFFGLIRFVDCV